MVPVTVVRARASGADRLDVVLAIQTPLETEFVVMPRVALDPGRVTGPSPGRVGLDPGGQSGDPDLSLPGSRATFDR